MKNPTLPAFAGQAAIDIRKACDRLVRLYSELSASGVLSETEARKLSTSTSLIDGFRGVAGILDDRVEAGALAYFDLEAGDDRILPLRQWAIYAACAAEVCGEAEHDFSRGLVDSANQGFKKALCVLGCLTLEIDDPPQVPKADRLPVVRRGHIQH